MAKVMVVAHQILRGILLFFGVAMTLFGLWDLLVPRARFVNSDPAAGAAVSDVPSAVTVHFNHRLTSDSHLNVSSTVQRLPSGELEYLDGSSVITKSEIDSADNSGQTLRAHLRPGLHEGLYWVSWNTKVRGWGTSSYGKMAFGVGMAVPEHLIKDMDGTVWERNYQHRSRRATLVGGVIMLLLGAFIRVRR